MQKKIEQFVAILHNKGIPLEKIKIDGKNQVIVVKARAGKEIKIGFSLLQKLSRPASPNKNNQT